MSKESNIVIKKVPISQMLDLLSKLYNVGVEFIDIHGVTEGSQHTLGVTFSKEDMHPDYSENYDNFNKESVLDDKLTDNDINQLI